eukprot:PhM_4_TR8192/c3_g1_i1/m.81993
MMNTVPTTSTASSSPSSITSSRMAALPRRSLTNNTTTTPSPTAALQRSVSTSPPLLHGGDERKRDEKEEEEEEDINIHNSTTALSWGARRQRWSVPISALVGGLVLLCLAGTIVSLYVILSFYEEKAISELAERYLTTTCQHVETQVRSFATEASVLVKQVSASLAFDNRSWASLEIMRRILVATFSTAAMHDNAGLYFGDVYGNFTMAGAAGDIPTFLFNNRNQMKEINYTRDDCAVVGGVATRTGCTPPYFCEIDTSFNHQVRPWYTPFTTNITDTVLHPDNIFITDVFVYASVVPTLGISISRAVIVEDTFVGVAGTDISLANVNYFVAITMKYVTENTVIIVVDKRLQLLVTRFNGTDMSSVLSTSGGDVDSIKATTYPDKRIRYFGNIMLDLVDREVYQLSVEGTLYYVVCLKMGYGFRTLVAVPASDFLDEIYEGRRVAAAIATTIGLFMAVVAVLVIVAVHQPMTSIMSQLTNVAHMRLWIDADAKNMRSRITEVARLQDVMILMHEQLSEYKQYLPAALFATTPSSGTHVSDDETGSSTQMNRVMIGEDDDDVHGEPLIEAETTAPSPLQCPETTFAPKEQSSVPVVRQPAVVDLPSSSSASSLRVLGPEGVVSTLFRPVTKCKVAVLALQLHGLSKLISMGAFEVKHEAAMAHALDCTTRHRGVPLMFFGDTFVASFNAVTRCVSKEHHALATALELKSSSDDDSHDKDSLLQFTSGMSCGTAYCGDLTARGMRVYSVIGQPMEEAFHLRRHAQTHGARRHLVSGLAVYPIASREFHMIVHDVVIDDVDKENQRRLIVVLELIERNNNNTNKNNNNNTEEKRSRALALRFNDAVFTAVRTLDTSDLVLFSQAFEGGRHGEATRRLCEEAIRIKDVVDGMVLAAPRKGATVVTTVEIE